MSKQNKSFFLLLLTAAVWGMGFIAQSSGGDAIGPFAYNGIRNFLGSAVLLPLILFRDKSGITQRPETTLEKAQLRKAGFFCGLALFVASSFQQVGITMGTSAGKAGFLTACYIMLVPILGIFMKKKAGLRIWIATAIAMIALYLLCVTEELTFELSDILVIICALCFAIQIHIVDYYSPKVDGVRLASLQFLWVGIFSVIPALGLDIGVNAADAAVWAANFLTKDAIVALVYGGVFSSGVGYTLQIIAQKGLNPSVASMLMSCESVFSVIFGFLILHERMTTKEFLGCVIMFIAIMIAQLPEKQKSRT